MSSLRFELLRRYGTEFAKAELNDERKVDL